MKLWPFHLEPSIAAKAADLTIWSTELAEIFGATVTTGSGVAVSSAAALSVPAVQSAVRVISESAASLQARVEVRDGASWKAAPDHAVQSLIDVGVSDWCSWFELVRDLVAECQTSDSGGIAWVNRTESGVAEVIKYDSGLIKIERLNTGAYTYSIENRGLAAADIVHMRSGFTRSPLTLAREAIGIAVLLERHTAKFFANGARPSGVLETPKAIGDEGVKKLLAGWKAAQSGADNAGKTPLLWDGTTYKALSFNSTDSQLLELRKFCILEIARAFRVPPTMLWDLDRGTFQNAEQMGREFLVYCLEPQLQALEAALRRALFSPEERKNHRIIFERDDLTRADLGARATAYSSLISARVLNPNEAREWEGLPPYAGGEVFENPNTSTGSSNPQRAADLAPPKGKPNAAQ